MSSARGPLRAPWRLWIDTGGTFTDALGIDPEGRLHRAKVLSSSALRAQVRATDGPRSLVIEAPWQAPEGFLDGSRLRMLGGRRGSRPGPADGPGEPPGTPPYQMALRSASSGVRVTSSRPHPSPEHAGPGDPSSGHVFRLELESPLETDPAPDSLPGRGCELTFVEEAPVLAARLLTGAVDASRLPPVALRLATTRGTNALLTRSGARVLLLVTRGFRDLLEIGTQQRPELFALRIEKPAPLPSSVLEVPGRLAADGSELEPLDDGAFEELASGLEALEELDAADVDAVAVSLLHAYRQPQQEERLTAWLEARGFSRVVGSARLAPLIGYLARTETAVVEAYLAPVIGEYLEGVAGALAEGSSLHVMTSAGGLVRAEEFRAKDSLLSGPAGGVVGAARSGRASGFGKVIPFDMGGTSTDVARYDGDYEYLFEHRVGDARLVAPALAIESVAAGGGSVCSFDGDRLRVGPESAGAHPGPACYGVGGPLTLTDVNLLLGRLDPERFEIPLEVGAAEERAASLVEQVGATGTVRPREELLEGLLAIADERMADAIREISVRRGYDPRDYALVAFGGAGAQHACAVAERLGVGAVVVPEDAGLLSARGLGAAVLERFAHRQVLRPLEEVSRELPALLAELAEEARRAVAAEGVEGEEVEIRRRILRLRFAGQDATLPVEVAEGEEGEVAAAFDRAYEERYGYRPGDREVEVESVRVVASSGAGETKTREGAEGGAGDGEIVEHPAAPAGRRRSHLGGSWRRAPFYERSRLGPGAVFEGPCLVFERHSATVVPPGWRGRVDRVGALILRA